MIGSTTNTSVEVEARMIQDSYRLAAARLMTLQEQNMKLARYSAGILLAGAEKQREAMQTVLEGSPRIYASLLYAPVTSPKNGYFAEDGSQDLPIEDYDHLAAAEIADRLDDLSGREVEELKAYEKKNKNRHGVVERFDRSLV